jgi:hypothetical protein
VIVLAALAVGPFVAGQWNADNLNAHVDGGWLAVLV